MTLAFKFVPPERVEIIKNAFIKIGSAETLSPVKDLLSDDFSYDEIKLVRAVMLAKEWSWFLKAGVIKWGWENENKFLSYADF